MQTFTVRDLREHTGALIHDAELGKLSLITKHGHPVFIALPFSEEILELGLRPALAMKLYQEQVVSLEKAAKYAGQSVELFIERMGKLGIPAAHYSPDDLTRELHDFK